MSWLSEFIFFKLMKWKLIGEFSKLKKYVVVVAPHTSWHDFFLGLAVRKFSKTNINYVGKKELFDSPMGWYFRRTGGAPIDRSKSTNKVDAIVSIFDDKEEFRLAMAPEGTRKKVAKWKTGFYYIAKKANIPIVMVSFDYKKKEVNISEPFYPTNNIESDFNYMQQFYKDVVGKIPDYT